VVGLIRRRKKKKEGKDPSVMKYEKEQMGKKKKAKEGEGKERKNPFYR